MEVVGLCEAPECGGSQGQEAGAHGRADLHLAHGAFGQRGGSRVGHHRRAGGWKTVPGSERTCKCDTVLVAVGLESVNEFHIKAKEFGLPVYAAGDAEEIAEASAAMFTGKIRGLEIARSLAGTWQGAAEWRRAAGRVLKSRPAPPSPRRSPKRTRRACSRCSTAPRRFPAIPVQSPRARSRSRAATSPRGAHLQRAGLHGLRTVRQGVCPGLAAG